MNKIKQDILSDSGNKASSKHNVFVLSDRILSAIDISMDEIPDGFNYPMIKYRIVKTNRKFGSDWVKLLEVNPVECNRVMGIKGSLNAGWIEPDGDCTVNDPPPYIVAEFWDEFTKFLAS